MSAKARDDLSAVKFPLIFVSDLHIGAVDDPHAVLFLQFLRAIDPSSVKHLILGGDVFDFCFGAYRFYQHKFQTIGIELSRLAAQGVRVTYLHGNHEFAMEQIGWQGVEFPEQIAVDLQSISPTTSPYHHKTLLCVHGDMIAAVWHYRLYAALARSFLCRWFFYFVPKSFFDRFCLNVARQSRRLSSKKELNPERLKNKLEDFRNSTSHSVLIVGHYHFPRFFLNEHDGSIISDSWQHPNYIAFDGFSFLQKKPITID